jgi:cobalt-zinc-cadmium efflux system outer membrane protein
MRALRVLIVLFLVWPFACHRPLTVPNPVPRYIAQPLKSDVDLERFLQEYGSDAAQAEEATDRILSTNGVRDIAVNNHPEVIAAEARVSEARAHLGTAAAWPNPELEGRVLFDMDGRAEGEGALLFTLPLGGRIGAAEEQAVAELDLAHANLSAARKRAIAETNRLLSRLAHAEARLALFESLAKRSRQYASLAKSRKEASMADPLDVALVLADAAGDRRAVTRARMEIDSIKQKLRLLMGLAPDQADIMASKLTRFRLTESQDELVQSALRHRSDLMQARLEVVLADRKATRAAAERVPDLQLGPAVEAREDSVAFGFMLAIPLPILQTGSGPYREALAAREGAQAAYWHATREAVSQIRDALNRLKSTQDELDELIGEAAGALEGALEVAEARYSAGKLDVLRLLSVHRAFAELKLDYLDLLLALREAHIDLELAKGAWVRTKEVAP